MYAALIAMLFLQAAAAPPQRPPPSDADLPAWSKTPTAEEMARAYPPDAAKANLAGSATLECTVGAAGELTACVAATETPAGAGFGAAGLAIAPRFHMPLKSPSGASMVGRTVRFPLRWLNPTKTQTTPAIVQDDTGRSGSVAFNCRVSDERTIDNCVVVDAKPRGTNLFAIAGEAALRQKPPPKANPRERILVVIEIKPR